MSWGAPADGDETDPGAALAAPDETVESARALLAGVEAELGAIAAAIERLELGTYLRCERCGGVITDGSLAEDPTRTSCAEHEPGSAGALAPEVR